LKAETEMITRTPTIKDVALKAEVSLKTVSRVINESDDVSTETRQKVLETIKKVGYRPNALARGLRVKKTFSIGVIIADITNSFHNVLVRGIEDVALSKNYSILLANSDEMLKKEKMYARLFMERQVEGLIIVPSAGSQDYLKSFARYLPIVFVDRKPKDFDASMVGVDNFCGAYSLTNHLIEHGYDRIALICHDLNFSTGKERYDAFIEALQKAHIKPVEEYIKIGNRTIEDAFVATESIVRANIRPQAIFASNNVMALGVMKALDTHKLEVPKDIAIVAFDDFPFFEIFRPYITTVSQPVYEMGKMAAQVLFEQMSNGIRNENFTLPIQLVVRESCGCVRRGAI